MIRLRGLRLTTGDDRGSALLMTVVFTVFAGGIMLVLLGILLSQAQSAQVNQKNTRTGYAAQAGIQAALSVLRSNTKTVGVGSSAAVYGDPTKLPQTLTGTADGSDDGTLTYSVSLDYYLTDPTSKDDAWLAANRLPYPISDDEAAQPKFVRIISEGKDAAVKGLSDSTGDRTITALYTFTTTTVNIPGGLIRSTDGTKCLKADTAAVGSLIKMVPAADCDDNARDMWIYDTDYRLKLAGTVGSDAELCITGQGWVASPTGTDTSTANATMQVCAASNDTAPGNQLWSWEPPGSWVGQTKANTTRSPRWLGLSGTTLVEKTAKTGVFDPNPSVGAGAASVDTHQIVNFSEFGRCMDVTEEVITKGYMILYPCKQDPTGTGNELKWNHKWYYADPVAPALTTGPQSINVRAANGKPYCLTTRPVGSGNTDVQFTACNQPDNVSSLTANQKFIRSKDTGDVLTSYTFQLASDPSQCLTAVPEAGQTWSHIRLMVCNGSATQKWNAPAITSGATFGGYKEIG